VDKWASGGQHAAWIGITLLVALDDLCEKFRTNRGRLIDKLVETVSASYKDGRVRCVTGGACTINRTDLPEVL